MTIQIKNVFLFNRNKNNEKFYSLTEAKTLDRNIFNQRTCLYIQYEHKGEYIPLPFASNTIEELISDKRNIQWTYEKIQEIIKLRINLSQYQELQEFLLTYSQPIETETETEYLLGIQFSRELLTA